MVKVGLVELPKPTNKKMQHDWDRIKTEDDRIRYCRKYWKKCKITWEEGD